MTFLSNTEPKRFLQLWVHRALVTEEFLQIRWTYSKLSFCHNVLLALVAFILISFLDHFFGILHCNFLVYFGLAIEPQINEDPHDNIVAGCDIVRLQELHDWFCEIVFSTIAGMPVEDSQNGLLGTINYNLVSSFVDVDGTFESKATSCVPCRTWHSIRVNFVILINKRI